MGWLTPRDWVAGEIVNASIMNTHIRDQYLYLKGVGQVPTIQSGLTIDNSLGSERLLLPLLLTAECTTVLNAEGEVAFDEQTHTPKYYNGSAVKDIGDHGSLGGLTDDDHTQYMKESVFDSDADSRITKDAMQWTVNKLLKGAGAGADPTEIAVPTLKVKAETKDLTEASGDVAYTGYGLTPAGLIILARTSTVGSIGTSDPAKSVNCFFHGYVTDPTSTQFRAAIVFAGPAANANQSAIVKTYDADGFTLTWTKTGSPTGTLSMTVFALP